jgi:hypothetical protein
MSGSLNKALYQSKTGSTHRPFQRFAAIAAAVVLILGTASYFWYLSGKPEDSISYREFSGANSDILFGELSLIKRPLSRAEVQRLTGAAIPDDSWSGWLTSSKESAAEYFNSQGVSQEIRFMKETSSAESTAKTTLVISTGEIALGKDFDPAPNTALRGLKISAALSQDGHSFFYFWEFGDLQYYLSFEATTKEFAENGLHNFFNTMQPFFDPRDIINERNNNRTE